MTEPVEIHIKNFERVPVEIFEYFKNNTEVTQNLILLDGYLQDERVLWAADARRSLLLRVMSDEPQVRDKLFLIQSVLDKGATEVIIEKTPEERDEKDN